MSQKFQALVQHRDDVGFVKLSGVIDEDNELADLTDAIPGGMVIIELGEIERINSCGVRDWVNWLNAIEAKGAEVVLVECSPAIVAQINLVHNFTGNGTVKSFYVPYFCPECDEEKVLLTEAIEMGPPPHEPPICRCDGCDLVMDFDDMPESYFAFLSSQKQVSKPDKVLSVLEEFGTGRHVSSIVQPRGGSGISQGISNSSLPSVPSLPSISGMGTDVGSRPGSVITPHSSQQFAQLPVQDYSQVGREQSLVGDAEEGEGSPIMVYALVAILLSAVGVLLFLILG